jgi:hypothetical protein
MRNHTKIYLKAFGYEKEDFIPSEISGGRLVDVHHIDCKGMGGDPTGEKDRIENLIGLTREEHDTLGDKEQYMLLLYDKHLAFMIANGVKFDMKYMQDKLNQHR